VAAAAKHLTARDQRVAAPHVPRKMERTSADSVLSKARVILEALSRKERGLGLSSLSRECDLPKATVYRLCSELVDWGVVDRTGSVYRLGSKLFELGNRVPPRRLLRDEVLPYMEDLFVAFRQTVHFAVLDGTEVLYIEKLTGHDDCSTPSRVAARMDLHCTAVGKAILAFSPGEVLARVLAKGLSRRTPFTIVAPSILALELLEIRKTGLAYDREEAKLGLSCLAVPVFGPGSSLVGSMSISSTQAQFSPSEYGAALKSKARTLSAKLKSFPPLPEAMRS